MFIVVLKSLVRHHLAGKPLRGQTSSLEPLNSSNFQRFLTSALVINIAVGYDSYSMRLTERGQVPGFSLDAMALAAPRLVELSGADRGVNQPQFEQKKVR